MRKGKSLKVVSLWASMLLLASVLAACAESSAPAANTTAPAPKPAAGATQGTGQTVPADAKSTVSLTYATYTAESMFFHENHKYWGAELEKRSGGRAKVDKWLWGGSLLKADQMTSGIGTGMATVGYVCPSYNPANWPLMSMADADLQVLRRRPEGIRQSTSCGRTTTPPCMRNSPRTTSTP